MLRGMQGSGNMNEMQQQMMNNPELMNQLMSSPHVQNAMQVRNVRVFPFYLDFKGRMLCSNQTWNHNILWKTID